MMDADFDPATTADWALLPARLFDGQKMHVGVGLRITEGRIAALCAVSQLPSNLPVWRSDAVAAPGYFDVQVNGGGGVLLNTNPTPQGLLAIAAAHRRTGTAACLPTLITDAPEIMDRVADAITQVCGQGGVAGLHLEGPHISPEKRGTHNLAHIRPFDERTFEVATRLAKAGIPVLLTLAPETVPPGTIARLARAGVIVSIGHTAATAEQVRAAIAEGARGATHLYNAMSQMTARAPGAVGAVIDSDLFAGFIADGHHVDSTMLKIAIRARPVAGRMVLVSDAMPTVGGPDHFQLYGEEIRLRDGKLVNAAGSLAGVHIDMATSVERLVDDLGLSLEMALTMATFAPADMMRLSDHLGCLRPGASADFVLLEPDARVRSVFWGGGKSP